jgi:hypothetical protein
MCQIAAAEVSKTTKESVASIRITMMRKQWIGQVSRRAASRIPHLLRLVNGRSLKLAKRSASLAILLAFVVSLPTIARADGNVIRNGRRLSVDFHEVPLGRVAELLKRAARITIRLPASLRDRKVTASFRDLEIGAAMEKLLKSASLKSSATVYSPGPQGQVTIVVVEAGVSGAQGKPARETDSPAVPTTDPAIAHDGESLTPQMRRMLSPAPAGASAPSRSHE